VGGGLENRVGLYWQWGSGIQNIEDWDNNVFALVDRSQGDRLFASGHGRVKVEQPGRYSVQKEIALKALLRFADTLELDDELDWDFVPSVGGGAARPVSSADLAAVHTEITRRMATLSFGKEPASTDEQV
jgi:hypothetical protein